MTLRTLLTAVTALAICGPVAADTIQLRVDLAKGGGALRAAVFDSAEAFDNGVFVGGAITPAVGGENVLMIKGLSAGTYGIAIYHDVNGDEELDRNLLGAPTEPFGFSNNPKIGFSAPEFDAFAVAFDGTELTLDITLNGE